VSLLVVVHLVFALHNSLHFGEFLRRHLCECGSARREGTQGDKYKVGGEIRRYGKERGRAGA